MKNIFILLGFLLTTTIAVAQNNSWKITLNNKVLIATVKEDEAKNTKKIKAADWKKNGYFQINYKEKDTSVFYRSFLFFDENDNEILRKDTVRNYKIPAKDLIKLFAGKKEIHIYTIISPKDPNLAIRVRRVHLCTLQLQ